MSSMLLLQTVTYSGYIIRCEITSQTESQQSVVVVASQTVSCGFRTRLNEIFEINDEENLRKSQNTIKIFTQMTSSLNLKNDIELFKTSTHKIFGINSHVYFNLKQYNFIQNCLKLIKYQNDQNRPKIGQNDRDRKSRIKSLIKDRRFLSLPICIEFPRKLLYNGKKVTHSL